MTVAGLRLDTSSADDPTNEQGPRWRPLRQANVGFTVRHPSGSDAAPGRLGLMVWAELRSVVSWKSNRRIRWPA